MQYNQIPISDAMRSIRSNEYYLPAIQRKFVWKEKDIYKLFDSLMQGFPIGTFLFWRVEKEQMNRSIFYSFISDFHELDSSENKKAPTPETRELITGVLDGQQRLTSLYIALQGSFACRSKGAKKLKRASYTKKELYLDLLSNPDTSTEEDMKYRFQFLCEADLNDNESTWMKVKDVLSWDASPDIDAIFEEIESKHPIEKQHRSIVKRNMRRLHEMTTKDKAINFFSIEKDFESALDIFVRVNSAGEKLTKSDLLFSTIVATWENAREASEELKKELGEMGFDFDKDFILRACIFVCDISIKFSVDAFHKENTLKIQRNWQEIRKAIVGLAKTLRDIGFNRESITSQNAMIPIVYYIFKNGTLGYHTKGEIRKYLLATLIKQTFGGHTDTALKQIKDAMQINGMLIDREFSYKRLSERLQDLEVKEEDIDDILEYRKGSKTLAILTILYPNFRYAELSFHQDHMFSKSKNANQENVDKLANLQILEGIENNIKHAKTFGQWIESTYPTPAQKQAYLKSALIDDLDESKIDCFDLVYDLRKKNIRAILLNEFLYGR